MTDVATMTCTCGHTTDRHVVEYAYGRVRYSRCQNCRCHRYEPADNAAEPEVAAVDVLRADLALAQAEIAKLRTDAAVAGATTGDLARARKQISDLQRALGERDAQIRRLGLQLQQRAEPAPAPARKVVQEWAAVHCPLCGWTGPAGEHRWHGPLTPVVIIVEEG